MHCAYWTGTLTTWEHDESGTVGGDYGLMDHTNTVTFGAPSSIGGRQPTTWELHYRTDSTSTTPFQECLYYITQTSDQTVNSDGGVADPQALPEGGFYLGLDPGYYPMPTIAFTDNANGCATTRTGTYQRDFLRPQIQGVPVSSPDAPTASGSIVLDLASGLSGQTHTLTTTWEFAKHCWFGLDASEC